MINVHYCAVYVGAFLEFVFYEAKEVFLVHARRVVYVSVYFSDIVKVTMWNFLCVNSK
jgi:hypothetical protein